MLISYSPLIAGGTGHRLTNGGFMPDERRFGVDRVLLADDLIFAGTCGSANQPTAAKPPADTGNDALANTAQPADANNALSTMSR